MSTLHAKPTVLSLTDAAASQIAKIMAKKNGDVAGLRIGVKNGGCAGMEYTMDWATEIDPLDEVIEDKGARVLIDKAAVLFLFGTEMDYEVETLRSGFVFNNPNQSSACGCGESVELTPISQEKLDALTSAN
ncbi:MAG TPA: Fe-S cluster assembly scaffold SufA [Rhizobiales bacterium]|nr:Fe-S cluster assembly scaffold SufA [Hyphomicrobiales bacterium]